MSFALNVDTYLICNMFNVDKNKLSNEYSGMTIDQIMEAEAKSGNKTAADFDAQVLSNPQKLVEMFELRNPGNKYKILSNMNSQDLNDLLPYLAQEDLTEGLNFFNKDKLLNMIQQLPTQEVANYALQMFTPEKLMAQMPEAQLNNVLMSSELSKSEEKQAIKNVDPEVLANMYISATGSIPEGMQVSSNGQKQINEKQVYGEVSSLPDDAFQTAMLSMPAESKQAVVATLTKANPLLYNSIDTKAYTDAIGQKEGKEEMLSAASSLTHSSLVSMDAQLPRELTAVVLTQMDTSKFAQSLATNFSDVLKQVVAA